MNRKFYFLILLFPLFLFSAGDYVGSYIIENGSFLKHFKVKINNNSATIQTPFDVNYTEVTKYNGTKFVLDETNKKLNIYLDEQAQEKFFTIKGYGLYEITLSKRDNRNKAKQLWKQQVYIPYQCNISNNDLEDLAKKYQPHLSFHEDEEFFPMSIEDIFKDMGEDNKIDIKTTTHQKSFTDFIKLKTFLSTNGHSEYQFVTRNEEHFLKDNKGDKESPFVYYENSCESNTMYLTYHMFYSFDPKDGTSNELGWGYHALDRESFTIELKKTNNEYLPINAIYAGHGRTHDMKKLNSSLSKLSNTTDWEGKVALKWQNINKEENHPIVYIAKGSHAIYPTYGYYNLVVWGKSSQEYAGNKNDFTFINNNNLKKFDISSDLFLHFSGFWVDGIGSSNYKFPPFTKRSPYNYWLNNTTFAFKNYLKDACDNYGKPEFFEYIECEEEIITGDGYSSPPVFKNIRIKEYVNYSKKVSFAGQVNSEDPLYKITITIIKPDNTKLIKEDEQKENTYSINMNSYSFDIDSYRDMLGKYQINITAENIYGKKTSQSFNITVIPKVDNIETDYQNIFIGDNFNVQLDGKKLIDDVKVYVLHGENCNPDYITENEALFECKANQLGNITFIAYYKEKTIELAKDFIYVDDNPQFCTPNITDPATCSISNGRGEKIRTCSSDGKSWSDYGSCNIVSCDSGYIQSGNSCIVNTIEPISLTPPTGVSATDGTYTDKVRITWDSVSGASEYHIHRASTSSGYYVPLGKVSSTLFDDINTNSNITYYYKVKAYNISTDYSAYSDDGSYSDYNGGYSSN